MSSDDGLSARGAQRGLHEALTAIAAMISLVFIISIFLAAGDRGLRPLAARRALWSHQQNASWDVNSTMASLQRDCVMGELSRSHHRGRQVAL